MSLAAPTSRRPPFFWVTLGFGTVLVFLFVAALIIVARLDNVRKDLGWRPGFADDGATFVQIVDAGGPAAGRLIPGDRLRAVDGDTRLGPVSFEWLFASVPPGGSYRLRVEREGAEHEMALATARTSRPGWMRRVVVHSLVFLSLVGTGLVVGLLRPRDRVAQLYSLATLLSAPVLFASSVFIGPLTQNLLSGFGAVVTWSMLVHSPLHAAVAFAFALRFPSGAAPGPLWRASWWIFLAGAACVCALYNLRLFCTVFDPHLGVLLTYDHPRLWQTAWHFSTLLSAVGFGSIPAAIVRNYRADRDPGQRQRMKWAIAGATIGFLPSLAVWALRFVEIAVPVPGLLPRALPEDVAYLFLVVAPVSVAYAIVKHHVFGIEIVVRRGLQHLLARNVLRVALFLPLAFLLVSILMNPDRTVGEVLFRHPGHLVLIVAGTLSLRFRGALTQWLDRRFFREAYRQEQFLLSLLDDIRALDSLPALSRLVGERLTATLHPEEVNLVFRGPEGHGWGVEYSSAGQAADLQLADDSGLVRSAATRGHAVEVGPDGGGLADEEREWLRRRNVRLAVPMLTAEGLLVGLMLLGAKKSEESYTGADRRLLEAVAAHIAIVRENISLRQRVVEEARKRQDILSRLDGEEAELVRDCPSCGTCYDGLQTVCAKDGATLVANLPVRRTLAGKYRLERSIGKGGMGRVYEANDLRLGRRVAVKVLTGPRFGNATALHRFELEAQASARLQHRNIVTIHDYGTVAPEGAYLVYELLTGLTLRQEIDGAGALAPEITADWFDQILEGMHAAHAAGVIHRDLKPENIFVTRDPRGVTTVKILDFGLAKLRAVGTSERETLTQPGTVLGTLAYMSPEQLGGQTVDERTDIFSLGLLVIEALTGRHPFQRPTVSATVAALFHAPFHLEGDAKELRALDAALQRCLAKARSDRFSTVEEAQRELIPALRACPPFPVTPRASWDRDTVA